MKAFPFPENHLLVIVVFPISYSLDTSSELSLLMQTEKVMCFYDSVIHDRTTASRNSFKARMRTKFQAITELHTFDVHSQPSLITIFD